MIPIIVIILIHFCCLPCLLVYTIFFYGIHHRFLSSVYILRAQRKISHFISVCRTRFISQRMLLLFFKIYSFIMKQRNYLGQCLYVFLFCGGSVLFFIYGFPYLRSPNVFSLTKFFVVTGHFVCLFIFIITCTTDPGTINRDNALLYSRVFQHDLYYFPPNKICSTCHTVKFDHHCIWLGNCIGYFNHGKFLLFLSCHTCYLSYGVILLCQILYKDFITNFTSFENLFQLSFDKTMQFLLIFFNYLAKQHLILSYLLLCCVTFSIALFIFLVIHFYQTFILQMTTNEIHKASHIIISDNSSYRSHRPRLSLKSVFFMTFFPHYALNQAKKSLDKSLSSTKLVVNSKYLNRV